MNEIRSKIKKTSRNPVRILILITRHCRQFSCKSEDRSQTRLFAYRYEWFRKKKKKKRNQGNSYSPVHKQGNKRDLITKKFDQRF